MTPQRALPAGTDTSPTLIVAGLGVRGLAESARRAGWRVLALDAFGDQDTRRASAGWWSIAADSTDDAAPRIAPGRLLAALQAARLSCPNGSDLLGWVAGSGFEAQPELLYQATQVLPLLGMSAAEIAALRRPRRLFATLTELGFVHPEVAFEPPVGTGWLVKDMASSGGQAVRRWPGTLANTDIHPNLYWQREATGRSLGCLLLARGHDFRLLGVHDQLVEQTNDAPFRFAGLVGPVELSDSQMTGLLAALQRLVMAFALRGLVSVDWLLDGDRWLLLEVNPRPSASLAVHERLLAQTSPRSLLADHVAQFLPDQWRAQPDACDVALASAQVDDRLPSMGHCGGELIVYAPVPLSIDSATLARWAAATDLHDVPSAPLDLPAGGPLLSVSAVGTDTAAVLQALMQRRADVLQEPLSGSPGQRSGATASPTMSCTSSRGAFAAEAITTS